MAEAIRKVEEFHVKPKDGLDEEMQMLLSLIKEQTGQKIGEIYSVYAEKGGDMSYKSFYRRITKLEEGKFIRMEKTAGKEGNSTLLHYQANKKLTEY